MLHSHVSPSKRYTLSLPHVLLVQNNCSKPVNLSSNRRFLPANFNFEMSSSLVNYASRVLSVDQESTSFVPIVGLNKAADMPIFDAMMLAWRDCAKLHVAIDEDDIEVRADGIACA